MYIPVSVRGFGIILRQRLYEIEYMKTRVPADIWVIRSENALAGPET